MKKVLWVMNSYNSSKTDISPALIWWYGILENMGYEVFYYPYEDYNIEDLYETVRDNKPDFVIVAAYNNIHTELLRLREHTKVYVLQSDDRWRYANFSKFWIPFIDGVITFEGELTNYVSDGLKTENFNKMKWSFNPNMMSKLDPNIKAQKILVSHTGGMHGDRRNMLAGFSTKGVEIFNKQTQTYDETKAIWKNSKFSMCFTNNSLNSGKELKGRVVEIPNWCILVTEHFPDMEQYYDMENDVISFVSIQEAIDKINKLNFDDKEYKRIFENGKRKLWNQNTAYHEWNKILSNIDIDYKPIDVISLLKEKHGEFYCD
jgi:hypothetical protein